MQYDKALNFIYQLWDNLLIMKIYDHIFYRHIYIVIYYIINPEVICLVRTNIWQKKIIIVCAQKDSLIFLRQICWQSLQEKLPFYEAVKHCPFSSWIMENNCKGNGALRGPMSRLLGHFQILCYHYCLDYEKKNKTINCVKPVKNKLNNL